MLAPELRLPTRAEMLEGIKGHTLTNGGAERIAV